MLAVAGVLIALGHSYVAGVNPDPTVPAWPELVASAAGLPLVNHGIGGAESPLVARRAATVPVGRRDVVVVQAALNDVARRGADGLPRYRRALTGILRHVARARRVVVVLDPPVRDWALPAPFDRGSTTVLRRYNRASARLARRFGARTADAARGWDPATDIGPDGIHPSWPGTLRIAARVRAQMPK